MKRLTPEEVARIRRMFGQCFPERDLFAEIDVLSEKLKGAEYNARLLRAECDEAQASCAALHLALAQVAATIRAAGQERECRSALAIADRALAIADRALAQGGTQGERP